MRDFAFGPIILDISNNKDLYEGIENYCFSTIDDFRAPNVQLSQYLLSSLTLGKNNESKTRTLDCTTS